MNTLKIVQSNSLSTLVQEEITRMILAGEIATGEWLNESAFSQRFGVSRGPVREALRSLQESGLVRQEKNRGVFVRELTVAEADQIYEVREALDELIGKRVAAAASKAQIGKLRELVEKMDQSVRSDDLHRYYLDNLKFHDLLANLSGNAKLMLAYRRLINELHLFRLHGLAQFGGLRTSNEEHHALLKAIETKNPEAAGRLLKAHVVASRRRMHKALAARPLESERCSAG